MLNSPRIALALWLAACGSREPAPLMQSVNATMAACDPAEIKFLAARHNVQLAFEPCGHNAFTAASWSPDGTRLLFQLGASAHILHGTTPERRITAVSTPQHVGAGAWLSDGRVAVPVVAAQADGPLRVAVVDLPSDDAAGQLVLHAVPEVSALRAVLAGPDPGAAFLVAERGGAPALLRLDLASGAVADALPGLPAGRDVQLGAGGAKAVVGRGDAVELVDVATGAVERRFPGAVRGALSPAGDWLVLEHPGAPVSPFFQRTWDELTPAAREREEERAKAAAKDLPRWAQETVAPPTLDLVELASGRRWTLRGMLGEGASWYPARPGWLSFRLWGFEGKQVKSNVALVDLSERLAALSAGKEVFAIDVVPDAPAN